MAISGYNVIKRSYLFSIYKKKTLTSRLMV